MNRIHPLGIAAALALAAIGSQAQTIETDYPLVGGTAIAAERVIDSRDLQPVEPALVQSNAEGPKVIAGQRDAQVSNEPVRTEAQVRFLRAPDVDPV
ncbi:MAG TPA: hypothetical protein VK047_13965 [Zeimonas sp.]|nr:hypothetical protein [Zeimonas sp.]